MAQPWKAFTDKEWAFSFPSPRLNIDMTSPLGEGSTNRVYKATLNDQPVVVKAPIFLLDPVAYQIHNRDHVAGLYQPKAVLHKMLEEMELHITLNKDGPPELVKFLGLGWTELHGIPVPTWMILERCDKTLEQRLARRGALSKREVVDICL